MPKLKIVTAKKLLRWLEKKGFLSQRQKGSHVRVSNGCLQTTIPVHSTDLPRGTIRSILKDLEIPIDIYQKEL